MLMEESLKFQVQIMGDGIRYRKKRKHNELSNPSDFGNEANQNENISKGKVFKYSHTGGVANTNAASVNNIKINNNIQTTDNHSLANNNIETKNNKNSVSSSIVKEGINTISNIIESKNKLTGTNNIKSNVTTINIRGNTNKNINTNFNTNLDNNLKQLLENCFINIEEIEMVNNNSKKKQYIKELEKTKVVVKKFEEYFHNDFLKLLVKKAHFYCDKNIKINRTFKVTNIFKNDKFILDRSNYTNKTTIINLELMTIDLLLSIRNHLESLLEVDCPNLGNLLFCYFSQITNIFILKSVLTLMESNIVKYSETVVIKLKNIENLSNKNKIYGISQIYDIFKQSYLKISKIAKSTNKEKQISNDYETLVYNEISNNFEKNMGLKKLFIFNYDSHLQNIFTLNENYFDLQIKNSNLYNNCIESAHSQAIDNNKKKIKIYKVKSELKNNYQEIFSIIANLDVFYLNTSDLIKEYLEN